MNKMELGEGKVRADDAEQMTGRVAQVNNSAEPYPLFSQS